MDYQKQAQDFLNQTSSTLKIELAENQSAPLWNKPGDAHGKRYAVTLASSRGSYSFDFWDSIHNREAMDALDLLNDFRGFSMNSHDFTNGVCG